MAASGYLQVYVGPLSGIINFLGWLIGSSTCNAMKKSYCPGTTGGLGGQRPSHFWGKHLRRQLCFWFFFYHISVHTPVLSLLFPLGLWGWGCRFNLLFSLRRLIDLQHLSGKPVGPAGPWVFVGAWTGVWWKGIVWMTDAFYYLGVPMFHDLCARPWAEMPSEIMGQAGQCTSKLHCQ